MSCYVPITASMAQAKPLLLNKAQSKDYASMKTRVFRQFKEMVGNDNDIMTVTFEELPKMSMVDFAYTNVVWYANNVLKAGIKVVNHMQPSKEAVDMALDAIEAGTMDGQEFTRKYINYAFTDGVSDLGFYAKDNDAPRLLEVSGYFQNLNSKFT
jgi:hypothetical protein